MGCLNSTGNFNHWFGNIHLSGPCNRSCYFCIGQHMMALDPLNNLDTFPLAGLDLFIEECNQRGIGEVNLTGTNTDPLLYRHIPELRAALSSRLRSPLRFGCRTNGAAVTGNPDLWSMFDKASITICSMDAKIHTSMMGTGRPADIRKIVKMGGPKDVKVNIVLGPENRYDVYRTLDSLVHIPGILRVNLREPYGQPHIGDPLAEYWQSEKRLGMPVYNYHGLEVAYWDVHYCEVESVNLYANGNVSTDYPITRGHDAETGDVKDQSFFPIHGRQRPQWVTVK